MAYIIRNVDTNEIFPITALQCVVGRSPQCDIFVDEKHVSRHHAEIHNNGEKVTVKDNNSTNGTFVNDEKIITEAILQPLDLIRFGKTIFEISEQQLDMPPSKYKKGLLGLFARG